MLSINLTAQTISGIINSYHKVLAVDLAQNKLKLDNITGLNAHDRILIIQMKGATINSSNSSSFGNITAVSNAGNYEFATICGFYNDTILLKADFVNSYDVAGLMQVVKIPSYTNVTITDSLKAQAWDATTGKGGVLALEASGTVTLNSGITASGAGFNGGVYNNFGGTCSSFFPATAFYYDYVADGFGSGAYKGEGIADYVTAKHYGKGKQANGGGGGNNHNAGGAGGGNYGSGGNGGNQTGLSCNGTNAGSGGASLSSYGYTTINNKIFMGGGGGAGHANNDQGVGGGNGGGIVIISCNTLDAGGHTIEANGMQPFNQNNLPGIYEANGDGGGGGGAGGIVIIDATTVTNNITAEAKGGVGNNSGFQTQCTGPGGGGGGGVVWLSSNSIPGNVTASVNGGANGVVKVAACLNSPNGATSGSDGTTVFNYIKPERTIFNCTGLPLKAVINFSGRKNNNNIVLSWVYTNADGVKELLIQKSYDNNFFSNIKKINYPGADNNLFTDKADRDNLYYRLKITTISGEIFYSPTLSFKYAFSGQFKINPNPASNKLNIELSALKQQSISIVITDVNGRMIWQQNKLINKGTQNITSSLNGIARGIYFIRVMIDGTSLTEKLVIQ